MHAPGGVAARLLVLLLSAAAAAAVWAHVEGVPLLQMLRDATAEKSPHDEYVELLDRSGLTASPLGRAWMAAAAQSLEKAPAVAAPFRRTVAVGSDDPVAFAYRIDLRRGPRLDVTAPLDGSAPATTFVDLFDEDTGTRRAGAQRGTAVEASDDERVIVRVQPELLRGGRLEVSARVGPALLFPVEGVGAASLHSVFGDPRDAGRRRHEGVDIFAPQGTPVLSATGGMVTRVSDGGIGGRVVWVWDAGRGLHLYYAHLHEQLVARGTRVGRGDVLGTVGNTGNAQTTAPHLHFGIYERGRGAIDPDAFIRPAPAAANAARARPRTAGAARAASDPQPPAWADGADGNGARLAFPER